MSNGKDMIIHLIVRLIKRFYIKTSQYFPIPYEPFGGEETLMLKWIYLIIEEKLI